MEGGRRYLTDFRLIKRIRRQSLTDSASKCKGLYSSKTLNIVLFKYNLLGDLFTGSTAQKINIVFNNEETSHRYPLANNSQK